MLRLLVGWLLNGAAVLLVAYLLPWAFVDTFGTALIVALVLGVINITVKPFLLIVTLPVNILTLGLFTFVINGALILVADKLIDGFAVTGFLSAVLFSVVLGLVNALFGAATR